MKLRPTYQPGHLRTRLGGRLRPGGGWGICLPKVCVGSPPVASTPEVASSGELPRKLPPAASCLVGCLQREAASKVASGGELPRKLPPAASCLVGCLQRDVAPGLAHWLRGSAGWCLRRGGSGLRDGTQGASRLPFAPLRAEQTASCAASPAVQAGCVAEVEGARAQAHAKPGLRLRHRPARASPRVDGQTGGALRGA